MSAVTLVIPGAPVGKGRPRFSTVGGFTKAYTPKKTRDYEAAVSDVARRHCPAPLDGALGVALVAFLPIPKSWPVKQRKSAAAGEVLPTPKPDLDNVAKAVLDGLAGICFGDDSQVCEMTLAKRYAEQPRVEIRIYKLTQN